MEMTIHEILNQLGPQLSLLSDTGRLDTQVLVAHHLEKPRSWVLAHPEARIREDQYNAIILSAQRLLSGEPLPYVLGHWEFYGLDFMVTPDVLIPRPETELLVERAIGWLQSHPHKRKVLDVGTGSGCIGVAMASHISDVDILVTDISEEALGVARRNAEKYGLLNRLEFRRSDLLEQVPEHFDMICANLPYIPTQILNTLPVADKEPRLALDGGQTGLWQLKRLLVQAPQKLDAGGLMLLEIDPTEREPILQMVQERFPGDKVRILQDLAGKDRCIEIERHYHILHLCRRKELIKNQELGEYRADSLASEGFIHCSLPEQANEVANRYFKGMPDLVMLMIDPEQLTSEIRWEESGGSYYPHVYGAINREAVYAVNDIHPDNDGVYRNIFSQIK